MTDQHLLDLAHRNLLDLPDKTLRLLSGHYRMTGQFESARNVIEEMQRRHGESGTILDGRADILEAEGRVADARVAREKRCEHFPDSLAWRRLARHLIDFQSQNGHARLAEVDRELARLNESDLETEILRAEVALVRERFDDAQTLADALVLAAPKSSKPPLLLARIAIARDDIVGVRRYLTYAMEHFGTRASQVELGRVADEATRFNDPEIERLIQSLRLDPATKTDSLLAELDAIFNPVEPEPIALVEELAPLAAVTSEDPRVFETLRDVFGYDELRPGQAEVIQRALSGLDTLAIMPTGAGKSLTFQIPALLLDAPIVVVSPLIALMHDQLTTLPERLKSCSTFINSTLDINEQERRQDAIRRGEVKLIYAAPERFRQSGFLETLRVAGVKLVVIDEAHCVSMWGHDFRPDYFFIPRALEELGDPPTLAITATATADMAKQIGIALNRSLTVIRTSAFRENLYYSVERFQAAPQKADRLITLCQETSGSVIVYVYSRKNADELAETLRTNGVAAVPYHAGMSTPDRTRNQSAFIGNKVNVIVATIAFGMGINKPDVRLIVHYSPSRSLEAYIQESGRAGRDGEPARCVLLYTPGDIGTIRRHAGERAISLADLRQIYRQIKEAAVGRWLVIDRQDLGSFGRDEVDAGVAVGLLEQAGLIRRHPDSGRSISIRWSQRSAESDAAQTRDRFGKWLTQIGSGSSIITVPTAAACDELDCSPGVLERALTSQTGIACAFRFPAVCLELLPATGVNTASVEGLLDRLIESEQKRAEEITRYLTATRCRHLHLAAHLSERIEPCGSVCDACTATPSTRKRDAQLKSNRYANPVYMALAAWRRERAREMVVPAFVVASDRLLVQLAERKPRTRSELREVPGIGAIKDRQFGEEIVRVIRQVTGAD